ncbi:hypothetical protein HS088_TW10G00290 [Tripterygium wilfordii]|uniref:UV-B-induced protein n=1 Tax=Tripterygium wilfordii TaxID=458696 RepID=A0A7J7D4M2_TRIWF|nr:UV-B-induced protein At3g17800, chloroplastic-like [Tripterygium wilfordii]KAF5741294.1 hypothetical protein HS088_TW10G00290 [Tripterygium wilfordii]
MDHSFLRHQSHSIHFLPSAVKACFAPSISLPNLIRHFRYGKSLVVRAGRSPCEPSRSTNGSLNSPLELSSEVGKSLAGVLQNQRQLFRAAVKEELKLLADDRYEASARMFLSLDSDEESLHRRIAEMKENECQIAVEDVMYLLIFHKFSEIKVPLVPKLSRCIYNGRLEILPSKDWELESIHSVEVLDMVREHVSILIGLKENSSVSDNWAITRIRQSYLGHLYTASILYGYFLKSASMKYHLERCLAMGHQDHLVSHRGSSNFSKTWLYGWKNSLFDCSSSNKQFIPVGQESRRQEFEQDDLRCYLTGFDAETLERCSNPKSKEAVHLIQKHTRALFGDEETGFLESDEVILTSFSSLKRLVLEAIAFGFFIWDAEEYVEAVYVLGEN